MARGCHKCGREGHLVRLHDVRNAPLWCIICERRYIAELEAQNERLKEKVAKCNRTKSRRYTAGLLTRTRESTLGREARMDRPPLVSE